eukprot:jgi/Picsp_1/5671/NSC_03030-R1_---NA---
MMICVRRFVVLAVLLSLGSFLQSASASKCDKADKILDKCTKVITDKNRSGCPVQCREYFNELSSCNEAPDMSVDGISEAIEQCQPDLQVYAAGPQSKADTKSLWLYAWVGFAAIALW